jgi:hypothetical protein
VWVTEVRPGLKASTDATAGPAPDLITPTTDPRILLSTIRFTPASPFDPASPSITACDDPDDEGRPYLLHTELIQELHVLGGEPAPPKPAVELATMVGTAAPETPTVLDVWFHLDDPVQLPDTISVTDEDGETFDFASAAVDADANGFSSVWRLTAPDQGVMVRDGLQVSALLPAATVLVKDATTTLAAVVPTLPPLLDTTASGDVLVYGEVRVPAAAPVQPAPAKPPSEFVTFTFLQQENESFIFEAWFHPEPYGEKPDVGLEKLPVAKIFDDITGDECEISWRPRPGASPNVFLLQVSPPKVNPDAGAVWLRHLYLTDEFGVDTPDGAMRMTEWIDKAGISYVGWEAERSDIVAFSRATLADAKIVNNLIAGRPAEPIFAAAPAIKATTKKATAKKTAAKKTVTAKKATARKAAAKKAPAKKAATAKKTARGGR